MSRMGPVLARMLASAALRAVADEVNIFSHRQPEWIRPLADAFSAATGIAVNVAFVGRGRSGRLVAEGDRAPADLVLTVEIARAMQMVGAGVTQPVVSDMLAAKSPDSLRDPGKKWLGLTTGARIICVNGERISEGKVTPCDDLADPK